MESRNDDILIHPVRSRKDQSVPPHGVFFVNPGEAKRAITTNLERGGRRQFLHNSTLAVSADGSSFIAGPAIGAPAAVLAMEKLIVLGARSILLVGWCGAIDRGFSVGDIVVPTGALVGEGTSQYYSAELAPLPSSRSVEETTALLRRHGEQPKHGIIWSTDAPYREKRSFLEQINRDKRVVGVDMEFSALCTVAAFRKIEFGAVLVVSDELWGAEWQPGFANPDFKKSCKTVESIVLGEKQG